MAVKGWEAISLGDLVGETVGGLEVVEAEVWARCKSCSNRFGRWVYYIDGDNGPTLSETGLHARVLRPDALTREPNRTRDRVRGPRTGSGLYWESWGGWPGEPPDVRHYLRIRCKCRRDEKLPKEKIPSLSVTMEADRPTVYL